MPIIPKKSPSASSTPSNGKLFLCDLDLENLRASGITDDTIEANKLRTEDGALVFPYHSLEGTTNAFSRRRLHIPRVINGKTAKYLQSHNTTSRAYFPCASLPLLQDPTNPICICEGEKKALALSQLSLAVVGVGGIWCGCKGRELIEDLTEIDWNNRTVYIVFDYDEKPNTRKESEEARRRLANALRKRGAKIIHNVNLPPGPNGSKQGVDDFLVARGAEAFLELLTNLSPDKFEKIDAMDLLAAAESLPPLEYLPLLGQDGYIIRGLSHALTAPPKAGKTELLYPCLKDWLASGETILYFTEEPRLIWIHRLRGLSFIKQHGLNLVFGLGAEASTLLPHVVNGEETIVIVDTLRALGLLGDDENDNSAVAKALSPWITACRNKGKTFIGLHHDRKTGGKRGQSVSGAHAIVGSLDIVLQLRYGRIENQRVVSALGRIIQPPDMLYQRDEGGLMQVIACSDNKNLDALTLLPTSPPGITLEEFVRAAGIRKVTAHAILNEGTGSELVIRSGTGKRGSPFRYSRRSGGVSSF